MSEIPDGFRRSMSRGIAVLTAMNADPDNQHAALPVLGSYFEDGVSDAELFQSMVNVAQFLLIRLEKLAGRDPWAELRYLADEYGER